MQRVDFLTRAAAKFRDDGDPQELETYKMDFSTYRRLETEFIALARACGFDGMPFRKGKAPLGTLEQEKQSLWLAIEMLPLTETVQERTLVREWARNIVLSSTNKPATANRSRPKKRARAW